jgi:hypothetical protein
MTLKVAAFAIDIFFQRLSSVFKSVIHCDKLTIQCISQTTPIIRSLRKSPTLVKTTPINTACQAIDIK